MSKIQVWVRLGGYITVDTEILKVNPEEAIIEGLRSDGFIVDGETYAVEDNEIYDEEGENIGTLEELGFEDGLCAEIDDVYLELAVKKDDD